MTQIHLHAEPGDYAPVVLLPGDPNRATVVAGMFDGGLEGARRVNDHRAMYGYTGTYQGVPVSVQTTGMGTPSLSIVVEELLRLGAHRRAVLPQPTGLDAEHRPHGVADGRVQLRVVEAAHSFIIPPTAAR